MNTDKNIKIAKRLFNHLINEKGDEEAKKILTDNPNLEKWFNNFSEYDNILNKIENRKSINIANKWKNHTQLKRKLNLKKKRISNFIQIAASIIVILSVTFTLLKNPDKSIKDNIINIKPGSYKATLLTENGDIYDLSINKNINLENGTKLQSTGNKLKYSANNKITNNKHNTIYIPKGGEFCLELADGTEVWLNSDTKLRYPEQFKL